MPENAQCRSTRAWFARCLPPALAALALGAIACGDPAAPGGVVPALPVTAALAPATADYPGAAGYFYFLPPLAPAPLTTGTFDPTLDPVVEICRLDAGGQCVLPLAAVLTGASQGSARVRVDTTAQEYVTSWRTGSAPAGNYRVRVLAQSLPLGQVDFRLIALGHENGSSGAVPTFMTNTSVPVQFRIDVGAISAADPAPAVTITSPAAGTVAAAGASISFAGTATDLPDGDLSSAIRWTSSLDGALAPARRSPPR